ncbi:hypothetical protein PMAYCL1PPCAC_05704, partial [Pristionchus mayeri]
SNHKRQKVGRPATFDDYHCKMLCTENTECLTYICTEYECFHLGDKCLDQTTCILPYNEWVKKTADADCTVVIDMPPNYDVGYVPNPSLAMAISVEGVKPTLKSFEPCNDGPYVMDLTLPDNSHRVMSNYWDDLEWDGKIESGNDFIHKYV